MNKLIDSDKLTGSTMYNLRNKLEHAGHLVGGGIGTAIGAGVGSLFPVVGTIGGATIGGGIGAAAGTALTPKFVGNKEDQEFTKLSRYLMDNMKDIFGARVTQQEVAIFMDSIPTLALTDEGKKAVIRDMKLISSGWKHQKEMKDEIVKANHGKVPPNLEQLVEMASAPFMDDLAKRFTEGSVLSAKI
jgi:hypothetical protein